MLKELLSLLRLLGSETGSRQIALGFALGFVSGMTPFLCLQSFLLFFLVLFFRVQLAAFFFSSFFFSFFAFLLDPLFHWVGNGILEQQGLRSFYTFLYNQPLLPYTRFNNSLVMGSFFVSLLLLPFVYVVTHKMIQRYRKVFVEKFQHSFFWKMITKTSLLQWFEKWKTLTGQNGK